MTAPLCCAQGNVAADGSRPAAARLALQRMIEERIDDAEAAISRIDCHVCKYEGEEATLERRRARLVAKMGVSPSHRSPLCHMGRPWPSL